MDTVEALVEAGADVNAEAKEFDDATPLKWAKQQEHGGVAGYLRKHGVNDKDLAYNNRSRSGLKR